MGDDFGTVRILDSLAGVAPSQWNALAGGHPFLRHELFQALHDTGCASERINTKSGAISLFNRTRFSSISCRFSAKLRTL